MTDQEAIKLALEALKTSKICIVGHVPKSKNTILKLDEAIKALEEALTKQEQDMPKIGCVNHDCDKCKEQGEPAFYAHDGYLMTPERAKFLGFPLDSILALYTTPQQRKPLTDEQIDTIANSFSTWMFPVETQRRDCDRAIARAIESAHGIKE